MNREEILEKSRVENQNKDIADIEASKSAIRAGWIVTVFLAAAATVIDAVVFGRAAYEILFAVLAGLAVVFFCKYAKLKKKHELFVAVIYSIASLAWLLDWILQMIDH